MTNWRRLGLFLALTVVFVIGLRVAAGRHKLEQAKVLSREVEADGSCTVTLLSQPYRLDRIYKSMVGPRSNQPGVRLVEDLPPDQTVFLTGVRSDVVEARSLAPLSNEFFCHANLTLNPETINPDQHNAAFSPATHSDWRFFTLVPGRMEIRLPDGFGIPVKADTRFDYYTMALNQNPGEPDRLVKMKTVLRYRTAAPGGGSIRPLFRRGLYVYQQHSAEKSASTSDGQAMDVNHGEQCGENCKFDARGATPSVFLSLTGTELDRHPGASCCVENVSKDGILKQFGAENTVHWMVPPGRHQYRTEVTKQLDLPRDTCAHYVTGHLHPFGQWMRLIDMETGKVVFEITAEHFADRLGVKKMSEIVSPEGIRLEKGRRYELVTEYNNTQDQPIDAMAIVYAYLAE